MSKTFTVALLGTLLCQTVDLSAETLVGPFKFGSGNYTVIPTGDFESGSLTGWTSFSTQTGTGLFRPSTELSYAGRYSLKGLVQFVGAGSRFSSTRSVSVLPGDTYVLSAFFYTGQANGVMYVDLQDASFEPHIGVSDVDSVRAPSGIATWQFAWAAFTIPSNVKEVTVRIVYEDFSKVGEHGFVDDVAITPASRFAAPVPLRSQEPSLRIALFAGIQIDGTVGRNYRIEYSTLLAATNWTILTNINLPASVVSNK